MQEDHVSMGWHAARKLRTAVDNLAMVIAIEYVAASRAIALRAPLHPSPITGQAVALLQQRNITPGPDRFLAPDLATAKTLVSSGALAALLRR